MLNLMDYGLEFAGLPLNAFSHTQNDIFRDETWFDFSAGKIPEWSRIYLVILFHRDAFCIRENLTGELK